eukprot:TRINITY_DN2727_c0_g1_i4.p1 TRINITY_DN2727_c0_g1~~TRINITY_DN2727_c0_g1_i4.p1  ORF type:complete len:3026 (-),score=664.90 TRINITY_DN2727_c0_g1_i4:5-7777(-)
MMLLFSSVTGLCLAASRNSAAAAATAATVTPKPILPVAKRPGSFLTTNTSPIMSPARSSLVLQNSTPSSPTAPPPRSTRRLVHILFDVFSPDLRATEDNVRARASLLAKPLTQFYVLDVSLFLIRAIGETSDFRRVFRCAMVYDVFFSPFFFKEPQSGVELVDALQNYWLETVIFLASHGHNHLECTKLLTVVDKNAHNVKLVLKLCNALLLIFKHNLRETQTAFLALDAISVLRQLTDYYRRLIAVMRAPESQTPQRPSFPYSLQTILGVRTLVLTLFDFFLASDTTRLHAALRVPLVDLLFLLLPDDDVRGFVLQHLGAMLKICSTPTAMLSHALSLANSTATSSTSVSASNISPDNTSTAVSFLFNKFTETIASVLPAHLPLQILLELLLCLRNALSAQGPVYSEIRKNLRESHVFAKLLAALCQSNEPSLAYEVVSTITALMTSSPSNRESFALHNGYKVLSGILPKLQPVSAFIDCLPLIENMIVEAELNFETAFQIQNGDATPLLLELLRSAPPETQYSYLQRFIVLVGKSEGNKHHCCSRSLLRTILAWIPETRDEKLRNQLVFLFSVLGTHSITVPELKFTFRLLKSRPGDFRPPFTHEMISALRKMTHKEGPTTFFDFDGRGSGIIVAGVKDRWPKRGYTFSTWLCIEAFEDPRGAPNYQPRLFSFLSETGFGVEAFFDSTVLCVKVSLRESVRDTKDAKDLWPIALTDFTFNPRKWYCLQLSHHPQRNAFTPGEIRLYINGALKAKVATSRYPASSDMTQCRIGSNSELMTASGEQRLYRENCLFGQMGAVHIFDDAIQSEQAALIFSLGCEFTGDFSEQEKMQSVRVFASFNAKAMIAPVCVDLAPHYDDDSSSHTLGENKLGSGVLPCVTHNVKDILFCLGGVQVLFPFFAQLDQPVEPEDVSAPIKYDIDLELCSNLLGLLADMLRGHPENEGELVSLDGAAVISNLLQSVSPEHLTIATANNILVLANHTVKSPVLKQQLIQHLLLDFRLWAYAPPEVQTKNLRNIFKLASAEPTLTTPQFWVDVLRTFFFSVPEKDSFGTNPIVHSITKEALAERPSPEKIDELRASILNFLRGAMKQQSSTEDFEALLRCALDTPDPAIVSGIISVLTRLLAEHSVTVLPLMAVALHLCKSSNEMVRASAIDMILAICNDWVAQHVQSPEQERSVALIMAQQLQLHPYTLDCHAAMMRLLLDTSAEVNAEKMTARPEVLQKMFAAKLEEINTMPVIKHAFVLPTIFALGAHSCCSSPVRGRLLRDIIDLCRFRPQNCVAIVKYASWQMWLFAIYGASLDIPALRLSCAELFSVLLLHQVLTEKGGWRSLENTLAVGLAPEGVGASIQPQEAVTVIAEILTAFFSLLLRGIRRPNPHDPSEGAISREITGKSGMFAENLVHCAALVEEFLFFRDPATRPAASDSSDGVGTFLAVEDIPLCRLLIELVRAVPESIPSGLGSEYRGYEKSILRGDAGSDLLLIHATSQLIETLPAFPELTMKPETAPLLLQEHIDRLTALFVRDSAKHNTLKMARVPFVITSLLRAFRLMQKQSSSSNEIRDVFVPLLRDLLKMYRPPKREHLREVADVWANNADRTGPEAVFVLAWDESIDRHIAQTQRELLAEMTEIVSVAARAREKAAQRVVERVQVEDGKSGKLEKTFDEAHKVAVEALALRERERRDAAALALKEATRSAVKLWRSMVRELTSERGPWCVEDYTASPVHWKLDKAEDSQRCRRRMKRNYAFNPHTDAARDSSAVVEPEAVVPALPKSGIKLAATAVDESEDLQEEAPDQIDAKNVFACELVTPMVVTPGTLEVHSAHLYFRVDRAKIETDTRDCRWPIEALAEIHPRRFLLRKTAVELFFTHDSGISTPFLNFPGDQRERKKAVARIKALKTAAHVVLLNKRSLAALIQQVSEQWRRRQISNFEYLMRLNTFAGRTYNDINQYPVFPWILVDYTSSTIDLTNKEVYRDLSKPIGALNPKRLEGFLARYQTFDEADVPKFMYGSHYSNAGTVLHYLIRMEPFTSLFIKLQGGHFDVADRLFHSLRHAWASCLNSGTDVKELIPEFFYLPEFLTNDNNLPLGVRQDKVPLGDVLLPPWARSPTDFIAINRLALESEYVSDNLHHWIDLIFGYKQQGADAEAAHNVFHYLTYERMAVSLLDAETDPMMRQSIISQIENFGQTPSQLLFKPHPQRLAAKEYVQRPLLPPRLSLTDQVLETRDVNLLACEVSRERLPVLWLWNVTTPSSALLAGTLVALKDHQYIPYQWTLSMAATLTLEQSQGRIPPLGLNVEPEIAGRTLFCTAALPDGRLFSCGYWDNSFRAHELPSTGSSLLGSTRAAPVNMLRHRDLVSCIAVSEDARLVATGSRDTTAMVWDISEGTPGASRSPRLLHVLRGHDEEIVSIAVDANFDIVATASRDGTCIVHTARSGRYVRTITPDTGTRGNGLKHVAISKNAVLILTARNDNIIRFYTLNGALICTAECPSPVMSLLLTDDGNYLVVGQQQEVAIFELLRMRVVYRLGVGSAVVAMRFVGETQLLLCLEGGQLIWLKLHDVAASAIPTATPSFTTPSVGHAVVRTPERAAK